MNKAVKLIVLLCSVIAAVLICIGGAFSVWATYQLDRPFPLAEKLIYEVKVGSSLTKISHDLTDRGLLKSPYLYKYAVKVLGMSDHIKAGEYVIKPDMTPRQFLKQLRHGANMHYYITFREGRTSFEIVRKLDKQQGLTGVIETIPPEGSLLPETYSYQKGADRSAIIEQMQEALTRTLDAAWATRDNDLPFDTKEEALILASIIEKETAQADERARIAGVFINRLNKGMKLQTDPTVIYAITLGKHKNNGFGPLGRRLYRKDLSYPSAYNTYLHEGLPPTPIANAGKAAIEAAVHPEKHDYLYFVADGTGGHAFSKTLEEHNRRAAEWRKARKKK